MKELMMETITIRPATLGDYQAVSTLFEQVDQLHADALPDLFQASDGPVRSQEWFAQITASQEATLFVAEQQGLLVGLVLCRVDTSPAFPLFVPRRYVRIIDLVVHESFQRKGIGRLLMQRVHEWTKAHGMTDVELDVHEFNRPARTLYEHLGYQTMRRTMWHRFH
jgi:ribosomal protein S18 acetylase RimI-like enzyme